MRSLVQSGKTVREAAKEVFGRISTYYERTTETDRETIYCKPVPIKGICRIEIATPTPRKQELEKAAKAEGKTVSEFVNKLIIDRLTLSRQTQTNQSNVLEKP